MANVFSSGWKRRVLLCLLLAAGTLALYRGVAGDRFLRYDDDRYVFENLHVQAGLRWSTVSWAFTSFEQANWHPLTWLSHALDCQLFGLNPSGHHATNLWLHTGSVLLLFLLFEWMTGYTGRSFLVAALFAVHPMNVESIAWVAERKNVLCIFFFFLTLIGYGRYARRPRLGSYAAVVILFAMALLSKPLAITLPFVLLLLDYWPLGRMKFSGDAGHGISGTRRAPLSRSLQGLLIEKLPLFAMSAASGVITFKAQRAGGAVTVLHPPLLRLENAIVSYALYIVRAFWPWHLAVLYPYPAQGWPAWQVAFSALLLVAVTALVIKYGERRFLFWGWFWYLGTMAPMIGLVQVGNQAMADRYAYLPLLGLFVATVWGMAEWASRVTIPYRAAAATAVLVLMSLVAHQQLSYWHDDFSLWSHTLAVTRGNFVAQDNFGMALIERGRYDEGIAHFRLAAEIEPGDPVSQVNLGIDAQRRGDLRQAVARYTLALQLASDPQVRASASANLGSVYFALHDDERARENFELALRLKGVFPFVLLDLGLMAQRAGDWTSAIYYHAMHVALEPSDVGYLLLGQALDHVGQADRARLAYRQAQQLSTDIDHARQEMAKLQN